MMTGFVRQEPFNGTHLEFLRQAIYFRPISKLENKGLEGF
jgi:hypothetical protein